MAETKPRQERKRHGVSWKEFPGEDIPKKRVVLGSARGPHNASSAPSFWELCGLRLALSFFQCWEANPGPGACQASALPLSHGPNPCFALTASPYEAQARITGVYPGLYPA